MQCDSSSRLNTRCDRVARSGPSSEARRARTFAGRSAPSQRGHRVPRSRRKERGWWSRPPGLPALAAARAKARRCKRRPTARPRRPPHPRPMRRAYAQRHGDSQCVWWARTGWSLRQLSRKDFPVRYGPATTTTETCSLIEESSAAAASGTSSEPSSSFPTSCRLCSEDICAQAVGACLVDYRRIWPLAPDQPRPRIRGSTRNAPLRPRCWCSAERVRSGAAQRQRRYFIPIANNPHTVSGLSVFFYTPKQSRGLVQWTHGTAVPQPHPGIRKVRLLPVTTGLGL